MKALLSLVLSLFFLLPLQARRPLSPALGTIPSDWQGVHFDIVRIVRLDNEHILVALRIRGDAAMKSPIQISGSPRPTEDDPSAVEPYSLTTATLTDQNTGKMYPADGNLPAKPYWGDPSIISTIYSNTWFILAARFKAPPPLFTPDGKPAEQRVTFHLPNAKNPLKDILIPH